MQEVLRTHQLGEADAARIALIAEGITPAMLDEHALGAIGLAGEIRIMVAEAEAARALAILSALTPARAVAGLSWRWGRRALYLLGLAFLLGFAAAVVTGDQEGTRLAIGMAFFAAAGLAGLVGVGLFAVAMVHATRERRAEDSARGTA